MKKFLLAIALLGAMALPEAAPAQTVTVLPEVIPSGTVVGLGNGPVEIKVVQGNVGLFTSSSTGVGSTSGSSTTLTLTATPATPPCIGCIIAAPNAGTITSGTTVTAFNGTTTVTLSAAMNVAAGTALA